MNKNKNNTILNLNHCGVGEDNYSSYINQTQESSSSTINEFNKNSKYLKKKTENFKC